MPPWGPGSAFRLIRPRRSVLRSSAALIRAASFEASDARSSDVRSVVTSAAYTPAARIMPIATAIVISTKVKPASVRFTKPSPLEHLPALGTVDDEADLMQPLQSHDMPRSPEHLPAPARKTFELSGERPLDPENALLI